MKKAFVSVALLGLILGGCASTSQYEKENADLKNQLAAKDAEIQKLKSEDEKRLDEMTNANRTLSDELKDEIQKGEVTINQLRNHVTVSIVQEVLFDSGHADLHEAGKKVLDKVANVLKKINNRLIMVEGHTDNVPIGKTIIEKYPTNWELSTARATTVVRYLQEKGIEPTHLSAAGFSEYRPVATNDTPENRQKNRRIDIVLAPEIKEVANPKG
jgi:chemotaxis protein MotB